MPSVEILYPACIDEESPEAWKDVVVRMVEEEGFGLRGVDATRLSYLDEKFEHILRVRICFEDDEQTDPVQMQSLADAVVRSITPTLPSFVSGVRCETEQTTRVTADSTQGRSLDPRLNVSLFRNVNELEMEMSVRAANCLKLDRSIRTVADLVQKTEAELLKTKGLGRRTLKEFKMILGEMGLSLGMKIDADELEQLRHQYKRSFSS